MNVTSIPIKKKNSLLLALAALQINRLSPSLRAITLKISNSKRVHINQSIFCGQIAANCDLVHHCKACNVFPTVSDRAINGHCSGVLFKYRLFSAQRRGFAYRRQVCALFIFKYESETNGRANCCVANNNFNNEYL